MTGNMWRMYILINYCGQRATGNFFNTRSIINAAMFELSFVTLPILFVLLKVLQLRNPLIASALAFGFVMLLWKIFEPRIKKNIDFEYCEHYYESLRKGMRVLYFILTILILIASFLFMVFSIKVIF